MDAIDKSREAAVPRGWAEPAGRGLGNKISDTAQALLMSAMRNVYRLRVRHPWLYGIIAFVMGGGLVALFTMSTYDSWVIQQVDLTVAFYQVIIGGLAGGIVAVIAAFAYAAMLGETLPAMRSGD